ncbi:hypothetical protein NEIRO03_0202 [Nematocida sp. AWRm78]|nr:hypothetical protein NEIRO02_0203 [Nematocida sp. AWRm79]KAI5182538.1 hypothetical protein NEIRO03_0202 [Nematocida sp. AWRm78]
MNQTTPQEKNSMNGEAAQTYTITIEQEPNPMGQKSNKNQANYTSEEHIPLLEQADRCGWNGSVERNKSSSNKITNALYEIIKSILLILVITVLSVYLFLVIFSEPTNNTTTYPVKTEFIHNNTIEQ